MAEWASWVLASAVLLALYDLAKKASVGANAVLPVLLASTAFGFAAYAAGLLATGHFRALGAISGAAVSLGIAKSVIVGTSWVFTFCALRTLPITIATPIRASAPALVLLIAVPLYGETPSPLQGVGMAAVFAGYFAFSWAGRHEGIDFFRSRAVWCAIAGADWLYFKGVAHPGSPISAASLMRRLSVVLTFLLGARFFHETNLVRKGIALAAIVAGVSLLALAS